MTNMLDHHHCWAMWWNSPVPSVKRNDRLLFKDATKIVVIIILVAGAVAATFPLSFARTVWPEEWILKNAALSSTTMSRHWSRLICIVLDEQRGMVNQVERTVFSSYADHQFFFSVVSYIFVVSCEYRAGKSGVAISLLKSGQVSQFTRMRRLIHSPSAVAQDNSSNNRNSSIVPTMDISKSLVRQLIPMYRNCIRGLKDVLEAEENGELAHTEPLPEEYFETSVES
jgi:hypothetical protein